MDKLVNNGPKWGNEAAFFVPINRNLADILGRTDLPDITTLLPLAYHGYHKPTLGRPMSLQTSGGHYSGPKKQPWATYPQVRGLQKYGVLFFLEKTALSIVKSEVGGFQKYRGQFSWEKTALSNVPTSYSPVGASRNMGPFFWKKTALSNVPTS